MPKKALEQTLALTKLDIDGTPIHIGGSVAAWLSFLVLSDRVVVVGAKDLRRVGGGKGFRQRRPTEGRGPVVSYYVVIAHGFGVV